MSHMQENTAGLKKALVTGSSRGIGFYIANLLVKKGVDVCITGRSFESLEKAKYRILQNSHDTSAETSCGTICTLEVDLRLPQEPARLVEEAVAELGGLDLLVNNAGISLGASVEETSIKDWDNIMQINARAPFFLCKEALPHLRRSECPTIVQIASVVSYDGYPNQSAYAASKHALVGFTKSLAKEVHKDGIRIYTISPGGVATDMIGPVRPDIDTSALIDPEEIAQLVWFFASKRGNAMVDHLAIRRAAKSP